MVYSKPRRRSAVPLVAAVVVGLVAIGGVYLVLRPGGPAAGRGDCTAIEVNASTEKGDLLAEIADRYNKAGRHFDGNRCAAVSVHKKTSGAAMDALAAGWDPKRDGSPAPQVWTPSSSLWLGLLRQKGVAADRVVLPEGASPSIAQSPVVIAMPKPMADAFTQKTKDVGWSDVLALASDPAGWGRYGHPEWGRFSLGKDNPHLSTSGLAATVATYYAASGRSSDLQESDLTKPEVTTFVRGVEAGVLHYADDSVKFLSNLADADAHGQALSYVSAVVVQEELVYLYNSGNPTGDRAMFGKGTPPRTPLVALYPKDGTLNLDHPYVVFPSASQDQKAAAADFLSYVQAEPQQQRLGQMGFRNHNGESTAQLARMVGAAAGPKLSLIAPPRPAVLEKILSGWDSLRKKAKVLLVMDVSGSMAESTGSGTTKLEAAKQAALHGLQLLHPDDEVGLWTFSTELGGATLPYQEVVPLSRIGDSSARLTAAVNGLHAEGGTALYATVRAAYQHLQEHASSDRINAVVVLTDGRNEYPRDNDLDKLLKDLDGSNLERSVRVFPIAFGNEADLDVLTKVGATSRAAAYDARDPANIDRAFISVLSNF